MNKVLLRFLVVADVNEQFILSVENMAALNVGLLARTQKVSGVDDWVVEDTRFRTSIRWQYSLMVFQEHS